MSQKNRDGKRTARERMIEERQRQARREERRKRLLTVGAVVGVLVVAGVVGVVVQNIRSTPDGPVATPPGAVGEERTVIPVGPEGAPATLTVYEDFRCPACANFEGTFAETVNALQDEGLLRVEYHLASFIDRNVPGNGSKRAANAAACAQEAGHFREYHDVLYANQPAETDDAFGDNEHLIELAGQVDGLVTDEFRECVTGGRYAEWVTASQEEFDKSGYNSTPTVLLDGEQLGLGGLTPESLEERVREKAGA
ncbi:DsbA family protein [Allostreptomyces psammosilenae]|uniref:Protein-disulfide isomerase n=1 Tax=Allostreptomyces psammosilenae TaxID=1892865 RepID=A0A853A120_9ACTN|nr:thioredoxin domain-containing protein [Allostreptomyces psammosilenae]NYI07150.1 protein-disulfide isomerase [Allostreptomyces psammosilenae]